MCYKNMAIHKNVFKLKNEQVPENFASLLFKVLMIVYYKLCVLKYITCLIKRKTHQFSC